LKLRRLKESSKPDKVVSRALKDFGGIRRTESVAKQAAANLDWFSGAKWQELKSRLLPLSSKRPYQREREVADWLAEEFSGFGPKQSRNFLQALGLTRYEIPIDSRISKWLRNDFGFPLSVGAGALGDRVYYCFVNDIIRELCAKAGVYPCVLDAVLFARVDEGAWNGSKSPF
jgi:hypothetical protein